MLSIFTKKGEQTTHATQKRATSKSKQSGPPQPPNPPGDDKKEGNNDKEKNKKDKGENKKNHPHEDDPGNQNNDMGSNGQGCRCNCADAKIENTKTELNLNINDLRELVCEKIIGVNEAMQEMNRNHTVDMKRLNKDTQVITKPRKEIDLEEYEELKETVKQFRLEIDKPEGKKKTMGKVIQEIREEMRSDVLSLKGIIAELEHQLKTVMITRDRLEGHFSQIVRDEYGLRYQERVNVVKDNLMDIFVREYREFRDKIDTDLRK